jgi:hypothetical protein
VRYGWAWWPWRVGFAHAQADASSLPVNLDHTHPHGLPRLRHVLGFLDVAARAELGDVHQAVDATQVDEGSERYH